MLLLLHLLDARTINLLQLALHHRLRTDIVVRMIAFLVLLLLSATTTVQQQQQLLLVLMACISISINSNTTRRLLLLLVVRSCCRIEALHLRWRLYRLCPTTAAADLRLAAVV